MTEISPEQTILIASSSMDATTCAPVAANLTNRGYEVITYEADKVAKGETPLDVQIGNDSGLTVCYDGKELPINAVRAAWYRRSTLISNMTQNRAKQLGLDSERKIIQAAIWEAVPGEVWLNSPERIRHAERKISQLVCAQEVGFAIPDTLATNQWETINDQLPEDIIFKASYAYSMFCENDDIRAVYTTPLKNTPEGLPMSGNPFPGLWQPNLPKAREWRITAVGDTTFDTAIYTDETAKDDWRKHQRDGGTKFRAESFPAEQRERCFEYLGKFGLRFGAFDFVEDPEGKITFLECNANGQFSWLENRLGFPISDAIADELTKIARRGAEISIND